MRKLEPADWAMVSKVFSELRDEWPVELDRTFGCLRWQGTRNNAGYGSIREGGQRRLAHQVAYERAFGPMPAGKTVEHACRRRDCVAPHHLDGYTRSEQEKAKQWSWSCRGNRCRFGHDMETAAVTSERGRTCRTCNRLLLSGGTDTTNERA